MAPYRLSHEEMLTLHESRQPELWGCFIGFLVISDVAIFARLWSNWSTILGRLRVVGEDSFLLLSAVFINAIIANLMVATHYGLGLHTWAVNAKDPNYPENLSTAFMHVWISMVLMSGFFVCIKTTLLLFYRRVFLLTQSKWLLIFWWGNIAYNAFWFIGSTAFYLFQCQPVSWYFIQYYERYKKPVPEEEIGNCNATSVTNVALPTVFSLISDLALLLIPILSISKLRLTTHKKLGLMGIFGVGILACLLEIGRIVALLLHTDDKTDPSYGVAVYLMLTAAEEAAAIVCACLPVIGPYLIRTVRRRIEANAQAKNSSSGPSAAPSSSRGWRSKNSFLRVASVNHIPTSVGATMMYDGGGDDEIHLTSLEPPGRGHPSAGNSNEGNDNEFPTDTRHLAYRPEHGLEHHQHASHDDGHNNLEEEPPPVSKGDIHVRTDIRVEVGHRSTPSTAHEDGRPEGSASPRYNTGIDRPTGVYS